MKVKANLPILVYSEDYHKMNYLESTGRRIIPGLKVKELGFCKDYVGLVYVGKYPSTKKIQTLLNDEGIRNIHP